jgi:hypothetical protein
MKNLIKAQQEYIDLLSQSLSEQAVFMNVHGQFPFPADIKKGKELRCEIEETKNQSSDEIIQRFEDWLGKPVSDRKCLDVLEGFIRWMREGV